jgi:integrase
VQPTSPGRHVCELSAGWQQRSDQLKHRGQKIGLSRFMRFCSALGIEPDDVTEKTLESFREHLEQTLKRPHEMFSMTAKAWHRAQGAIPDWPSAIFHVQNRQNRWTLLMSVLPESFCKDREAWLDRLAGRDLLDEHPLRPVRAGTIELRRRQLRVFASAVILRGRNPDTITSLRDLVEIGTFKEGLRFLLDRSDGKSTSTIFGAASALLAIARHHAGVDAPHLNTLAAIVRRLSPEQDGLTEKNEARLLPFNDKANAIALLELPAKLMRLAVRSRRRRDGALQAQIAVAVSILTFAPIRLDNLATLDCERNLVPSGAGQALHVVVPGEQVKNRKRIEHPLPAMCVKLIMRYLREFRPHLTTKGNTALFPGKSGGAKWQNVLRYQISRTVYAHTGLKVNPHLFRHIDAKLYLDRNPGGYEVVRLVLGHRSSATTRRFYSGTETAAAVRHFDETILAIGNRAEEKVIGRKTKKK